MNAFAELIANIIIDKTDVSESKAREIGVDVSNIIEDSVKVNMPGKDSYSNGFRDGVAYVRDVILLLGDI